MRPVRLSLGARTEDVRIDRDGEAVIGERRIAFERGSGRITVAGRTHRIATARHGHRIFVWCDGVVHAFERASSGRARVSADPGSDLLAPMPGRVRKIFAQAGQPVSRGAVLVSLEAMKMEHAIRAPRDGVVKRVCVAEGALVESGAELVELVPEGRGWFPPEAGRVVHQRQPPSVGDAVRRAAATQSRSYGPQRPGVRGG